MIKMPDSIIPSNMPTGYPAYLAYADGPRSKDAAEVAARFPGARILTLTVLGGSAVADGCDRETGDLSPASAAAWLHWRIGSGARRPVLYDSRDDAPGTLGQLAAVGVQRAQIRILSAHYGAGRHICSPSACGASFSADGTQWTDSFAGAAGATIDMSSLEDDFFGAPAPAINVEADVKLQQLQNGSTGQQARNWQGILVGHDLGYMIANPAGKDVAARAGVDGQFGSKTTAATKAFQAEAKLPQTGIVDAATWAAALG